MGVHVVWLRAIIVLWDDAHERLCGPYRWLRRAGAAQAVRSRPWLSGGRMDIACGPSMQPVISVCIIYICTAVWLDGSAVVCLVAACLSVVRSQ